MTWNQLRRRGESVRCLGNKVWAQQALRSVCLEDFFWADLVSGTGTHGSRFMSDGLTEKWELSDDGLGDLAFQWIWGVLSVR
jgi:hypothetical protein